VYELLSSALKPRAAFVPQDSVQGLTVIKWSGLKMQRHHFCVFKLHGRLFLFKVIYKATKIGNKTWTLFIIYIIECLKWKQISEDGVV